MATVERLAEDGFPGEGDDLQTALERLEEVLDGRVVAIARHPDQRRVVQVGLRLDELLDDRVAAIARHPDQRRVVQVGLRLDELLDDGVVAIVRHPDQRRGLGMVDLAQRLDGGLGDARPLACPAQLHELRHGSGGCSAQGVELQGGLDHGRVLLRLEAHPETVEAFLARGRRRGLGAVDLAQHLDGDAS